MKHQPSTRYRWTILFMVYLCMLVFAFSLQSLPPILTLVIKNFQLSHAQAGLLMSMFSLPAVGLAIFVGFLSDRYGPFRMGGLALVLLILGTLAFAFSRSFVLALSARFIAGIGAITLTIVGAQLLSLWFKGREVGSAMGIYNTAMPIGSILCFSLFGALGNSAGWQAPVFISAGIGIVGLAVFLWIYRPAPEPEHPTSGGQVKRSGFFSGLIKAGGLIWLASMCWLWFNASTISFMTFAPDFFVSKGNSIAFAGFLTGLLMWGSLILSPMIGRLIDKFGGNFIFIGAGGLLLSCSLFLVVKSSNFLFPMAVMALAVALVPTPVFSFVSKISQHENMGLGFGILSMSSGMGMFLGPYLSGLIRDTSGSYETTFNFLGVTALLVSLFAVILGIKQAKS